MTEKSIEQTANKIREGHLERVENDHDRLIHVAIELKYLVAKLNGHIEGEEQMMMAWKIMLDDMNSKITNTYGGIERLMRSVYLVGAGLALFVTVYFLQSSVGRALAKLF
jgi:hypothetical protein